MRLFLCAALLISVLSLSACQYHTKQPIDDTYYKKTQGIDWPE